MIIRFAAAVFTRNNFISYSLARSFLKRNLCSKTLVGKSKTNLRYLLILDFEATCDKEKIEQEIIEFPCLKVNLDTLEEESRFHRYVRPVINPTLPIFCTELTGILQEMVDEEVTFPDVYHSFKQWKEKEGLTDDNSIYITSGDWDLGHMMPKQCKQCNIEIPSDMLEWIDIKKLYANNFNHFYRNLIDILKVFNLKFEGRQHSGIDDCRNIHNVVKKLGQLKVQFIPTSKLELTPTGTKVHVYGAQKTKF